MNSYHDLLYVEDEGFGGFGIVVIIIALLEIISFWKLYNKAGKPGWAAIVPIYNVIVYIDIAGRPIWWIILLIIPFVNIVIYIILLVDFLKAYGKRSVGSILLALFFPVIYFPIMAFSGSTKYVGLLNE